MWHIRKTVTTEKNKTKGTMKNNLICKIKKPHRNESEKLTKNLAGNVVHLFYYGKPSK